MTFSEAISSGFRNYVGFSGRASRSEFWYWILFTVLVSIVTSIVDFGALSSNVMPFSSIWSLVTFLPSLAMGIRRLHDTDRSGWWWLLSLIPLIGIIVLIVFWCSEGTRGPNRFGPDPLGAPCGHIMRVPYRDPHPHTRYPPLKGDADISQRLPNNRDL